VGFTQPEGRLLEKVFASGEAAWGVREGRIFYRSLLTAKKGGGKKKEG